MEGERGAFAFAAAPAAPPEPAAGPLLGDGEGKAQEALEKRGAGQADSGESATMLAGGLLPRRCLSVCSLPVLKGTS